MLKVITDTNTKSFYRTGDVIVNIKTNKEYEVADVKVVDGVVKIVPKQCDLLEFQLTEDYKPTKETLKNCRVIDKRTIKSKTRGFEMVRDDERHFHGLLKEDIKLPKRATIKSAGYDTFAPFSIILEPGESRIIPTGIKSYMRSNEVLMAYPRSGHGFKYFVRLANTVGIIDSDYYGNEKNDGHILIKLRNEGNTALTIEAGEAMCQLMFQTFLLADGDNFNKGDIRNGGFGSTDK